MSETRIHSWQWCFSKIHRQFSHSENSAKIMGTISTFIGPGLPTSSSSSPSLASPTSSSQEAVTPTEHPASARSESISDELRGTSAHRPQEIGKPNKIDTTRPYGRPVAFWSARTWTGRWLCSRTPRRFQFFTRRSTKRSIAWVCGLAAGVQRKCGRWKCSCRALGKPWAWISRHFQGISWTSNRAASKKWSRVRVSIVSTRTSRRTEIAISAWRRN